MMTDLAASNATAYNTFWKNFGKYVKVGIIEDEKVRDDLIPLCRFFSSKSESNLTSLPEYVSRMTPDQKFIYYVVGETRAAASMSPALEKIKEKGYEVLYVSEPIDEMTLQNIEKYADKTVADVGKEAAQELNDDEKNAKEQSNTDYEGVRTWMKSILGERITRVEVSSRLVDSPATLVQSEYGVSPNMQKYLRAQAVVDAVDKGEFSNIFNQAVLEINPTHPVILHLKEIQGSGDAGAKDDEAAKELVEVIFSTAALAAGYVLDNSAEYAKLVTKLMARQVSK